MDTTIRATSASLPALTGAGLADVITERVRQIDAKGFTLAHDSGHDVTELTHAAASYLDTATDQLHGDEHDPSDAPDTWPWERSSWRPGDARRNLVKALALGLAALDRLDATADEQVAK